MSNLINELNVDGVQFFSEKYTSATTKNYS